VSDADEVPHAKTWEGGPCIQYMYIENALTSDMGSISLFNFRTYMYGSSSVVGNSIKH